MAQDPRPVWHALPRLASDLARLPIPLSLVYPPYATGPVSLEAHPPPPELCSNPTCNGIKNVFSKIVDRHYWRCGFCGFANVISGGTASSGQHSLAEKLHDERLGRNTDGEQRTTQEFVGPLYGGNIKRHD